MSDPAPPAGPDPGGARAEEAALRAAGALVAAVDAVATVAAGDAFAGALAAGIVEGLSLLEAARLGVACAALSTTRDGAQESMPSRREVDALLERGW